MTLKEKPKKQNKNSFFWLQINLFYSFGIFFIPKAKMPATVAWWWKPRWRHLIRTPGDLAVWIAVFVLPVIYAINQLFLLCWINLNTAVVYLCECIWILLSKRIKQAKGFAKLNPFPPHPEHSYFPPVFLTFPMILTRILENKELLKLVIIFFYIHNLYIWFKGDTIRRN